MLNRIQLCILSGKETALRGIFQVKLATKMVGLYLGKQMLIILNDNEMSISKNVGAISKYLNKVITNPLYNRIRTEVERKLRHFPRLRRLADYGFEASNTFLFPALSLKNWAFDISDR